MISVPSVNLYLTAPTDNQIGYIYLLLSISIQ